MKKNGSLFSRADKTHNIRKSYRNPFVTILAVILVEVISCIFQQPAVHRVFLGEFALDAHVPNWETSLSFNHSPAT